MFTYKLMLENGNSITVKPSSLKKEILDMCYEVAHDYLYLQNPPKIQLAVYLQSTDNDKCYSVVENLPDQFIRLIAMNATEEEIHFRLYHVLQFSHAKVMREYINDLV